MTLLESTGSPVDAFSFRIWIDKNAPVGPDHEAERSGEAPIAAVRLACLNVAGDDPLWLESAKIRWLQAKVQYRRCRDRRPLPDHAKKCVDHRLDKAITG